MASDAPPLDKPTKHPRLRRTRRCLCVVGTVLAILFALAIALGVGLGLTIGRNKDKSGEGEETPSPTPTSGPPPEHDPSWKPEVGTPWQVVLSKPLKVTRDSGELEPDVVAYDIDMFDNSQETIDELHRRGKKVICYFAAGSYEDWRDDADEFPEEDLGKELPGWPGERYLNWTSPKIRDIMAKRIKVAGDKKCDAIDPDNIDAYKNDNGMDLDQDSAISFVKFLSGEADRYRMATGLKNAAEIIKGVLDVVDFSVVEECAEFNECQTYEPFIDAGKPVFQIEYPSQGPDVDASTRKGICTNKSDDGFNIVLKDLNLDGRVQYCDGNKYDTEVANS